MSLTMDTKQKTVADLIRHLRPCDEALEWAEGYTDPVPAWRECPRGDWMLWLLGRLAGPPEADARRKLVLVACDCYVAAHATNAAAHATYATYATYAAADAAADAARRRVLARCADLVRRHYPDPPDLEDLP